MRDLAAAADASYTEYIAGLLRIGLEHRAELPDELQPKEVLPESA